MRLFQYSLIRSTSKALNKLGFGKFLDRVYLTLYTKSIHRQSLVKIQAIAGLHFFVNNNDEKQVPIWCIMQYINHCFDLLGSGWVCMNKQSEVASGNMQKRYRDIDWQRDFRSGYCFDGSRPSRSLMRSSYPDGVDIKSPWELSRMYHLPKLALAAFSGVNSETLFVEYKNQVFDFIAHNPAGFGVNWTCAMEVGIRAANILLAYDLFGGIMPKQADVKFENAVIRSMLEHGRFILLNLEKARNGQANGNHYLSNLCGLIFISAYIVTKETIAWRRFAIKELLFEIDAQFYFDGGSIEGSTAYHRLCSELSAYSVAMMLHCGVCIPQPLQNKLYRIAEFMRLITKADGDIIQIGDNDSGHLFRLTESGTTHRQPLDMSQAKDPPVEGSDGSFDADELWAGRASDALFALFGKNMENCTEALIVKAFKGDNVLLSMPEEPEQNRNVADIRPAVLPYTEVRQYDFSSSIDTSELSCAVMEDFGLAVYSCADFQLFVRLPVSNRLILRSHIHDDIFHWECYHDGVVGFPDPGSYAYTSNKEGRLQYRCNKAHNVPIHEEPFVELKGIWNAVIRYEAGMVECKFSEITMTVQAGNTVHRRKIVIQNKGICVEDSSNDFFICNDSPGVQFSCGYGKI